MKVVQVVPRYPPRTGGVETHVKELSERLVEGGNEVTVLTADEGNDARSHEFRNGVEVIRHLGVAPNGTFHVAPGILRTLSQIDADVLHAHNYHSLPLLFAAIAKRDTRFIATPHYHGGSASAFRDRLLSLYHPLGAWALRRAEQVIAVSDWEREQLQSDFEVDVTVIPNGIDVERFRDAEPLDHERPYLLTVGRLEEYKGVQHVIRALPELPEYDLLIAGSGPYMKDLKETAKIAEVDNQVVFLGYVADEGLPSLYAGAETYLTMSEFESFGITVGEALAAGTPAIVRDTGALSEWGERDDCVAASAQCIGDAVRGIVGTTAPQNNIFDWDDVVERIVNVYTRDW